MSGGAGSECHDTGEVVGAGCAGGAATGGRCAIAVIPDTLASKVSHFVRGE